MTISHPLGDLDHQLAMILVGIFAHQLGQRALLLLPLTFASVMALGGFLGVIGVTIHSSKSALLSRFSCSAPSSPSK